MQAVRAPSVPLLVAALFCSTAALVCLAAGMTGFAPVAAICAAVVMAGELRRMSSGENDPDRVFFARLVHQAEAGRRLAIYDRETGLFAHWYVTLRGQEECTRAVRYGRRLGMLVVEPRAGAGRGEWDIKSRIGRWFQSELRVADIAGYLGNGRFVVLAPESGAVALAMLATRLRESIPNVEVGASALPEDGAAFQALWHSATARLSDREPRSRAA